VPARILPARVAANGLSSTTQSPRVRTAGPIRYACTDEGPTDSTSECAFPTPVTSTLSPIASSSRVNKPRGRKSTLSNVTISAVEKALNGETNAKRRPSVANGHEQPDLSKGQPHDDSPPEKADTPVQTPTSSRATSGTPASPAKNGEEQPKLRLGMLGVGGYGAGPDEIGWSGPWPSPYEAQTDENPPAIKTESSCCGGESETPVPPVKSCCGGSSANDAAGVAAAGNGHAPGQLAIQQHATTLSQPPYNAMNGNYTLQQPVQPVNIAPSYLSQVGFGADPFHLPGAVSLHRPHGTDENGVMPPSCGCGDGCMCFACAVHPTNRTTTEYVLYHHGLALGMTMSNLNQEAQMQALIGQNGFMWPGAPAVYNHLANSFHHPPSQPQPYQTTGPPSYMVQLDQALQYQNPNNGVQWNLGASAMPVQPTPTAELEHFHLQDHSQASFATNGTAGLDSNNYLSNGHGSEPQPSIIPFTLAPDALDAPVFVENDGQPTEGDTPTMSPSSFLLQQYVLPGCSDATGTCQCGDGCSCEGCLTHGGHNGIPVDGLTAVEPPTAASPLADSSKVSETAVGSCCGT